MQNYIVGETRQWRSWYGDVPIRWGWLLTFGVLFILAGVIGLTSLAVATVAWLLVFSALLIAGGVVQLAHLFTGNGSSSRGVQALIAILYLAVGVLILMEPVAASIGLTVVIGLMFMAVGALRLFAGVSMRGLPTATWHTLIGLLELVLGILIIAGLPGTGVWVVGLFISVELIFAGLLSVITALQLRKGLVGPARG